MSQPTTPARSIGRSTLSTPSTARNGISPPELTPRSKVKAMLAAIDDDSDQGPTVVYQGQTRNVLSIVDANVQKVEERKHVAQDSKLNEEEEEEEEDEESLFLPRGRLAARLGRQAAVREDSRSNDDSTPDENAYARIRKRLLPGNLEKPINSVPETGERNALGHGKGGNEAIIQSRHSTPDPHTAHVHSPLSGSAQKPTEKTTNQYDSGSDSPANPQSKQKFLELVARKRAEREAKQAAEDKKRKEKFAKQKSIGDQLPEDAFFASGMSDDDRATDETLTQLARPTRKASKKAIEEISRETQRMSRNMQLAHQAKTKKKITKDSLFARFNFRTTATPTAEAPHNPSSSTVASSLPASDQEEAQKVQSPPTSPIEPDRSAKQHAGSDLNNITASVDAAVHATEQDGEDLPNLLDIMDQTVSKLDKGKGKAVDLSNVAIASETRGSKKPIFTQPPLKIRAPNPTSGAKIMELDSDSDLEVLPVKKLRSSRPDVFDRLRASKVQEGRSLQTLRALAHLTSPGKQLRGQKVTMSLADMQTSLQKRARQQAVEERAAKIEDLRSRGIVIQTAEERQQDQAEVEDMIEKARREGEEIMQKEKRAAKNAKIANGQVNDLPDTSDEDEDYREDQDGELEVELSGSEEAEGGDSEGLDELASDAEETANEDEEGGISLSKADSGGDDLVIDEASEDGDDEEEEEVEIGGDIEDDEQPDEEQLQRPRRNKMVIDEDDDEDDDDHEETTETPLQTETAVIEKPAFPENPFESNAVPMGMTQAFAATMANTQAQGDDNDEEQDSMAMFDSVPEPDFPIFDTNDSLDLVEDSQVGLPGPGTNPSKEIELQFSQSQIQYDALEDTQDLHTSTQLSEIPDPTQDVGFALSSPAPQTRFISEPPSTVDTLLLSGAVGNGSPVKKKRGRLQRRVLIEETVSDVVEDPLTTHHEIANSNCELNAFDAMRKATKAAKAAAANEAFDRKKSEAKGMVEEQAQESEDEYAGLGGASDEESGEEDEDVKAMMDHGEINVDESKLAGFYADRERASDEKAVAKLYKDINSGMLRKKRGDDFDLSDSDDDAEARKKRKRIEFAKMRKALLADEKVGKIAEDPKKLAFLQSIEDRNPDDDFDFLDRPAEDSFRVETDTQEEPDSQSQQPTLPAPQTSKRKRPLTDSIPDSGNMRPPPAARRTAATKKPVTLAEIRQSVSFLIEDPGSITIAQEPFSSASEDEGNPTHHNPRRTSANPIIDRLSLKRAESASTSTSSRLAFHDPASSSSIGGFKVPSLLRRATTSQLSANDADANGISTAAVTERAAGGGEKGDFVRRGGTKRSSVNFVGRERERSGVVEGVERRRREGRERAARERRGGLGALGVGSFE